jgi:signal transduction histidine kinase
MQVIRRLKINAAGSAVAAVIILVVLFIGAYRVNQAMKKLEIADNIMSASFERVALRSDYHRTGSESAKTQYLAKHEQISRLLKDASLFFKDAEDKETIKEMINSHDSIGRIFAAIVANREAKILGPSHSVFSQEIENGLIGQLNMRLYKVVSHVNRLHESSRKALFSALSLGGGGIICLLAILIVAAVINSLTMGRTIADRIRNLLNGALVIGSGDLDYKIDVKGDDEFTELSGAFNEMTTKLRGSYDNLEGQINERKKAEQEINRLNDDLRVRNEKLELANQELEAFSYSVSHDLRAPLRHMSGFAELLNKRLQSHLDEQTRHYMDAINKASKKMGMLIDDLLAFSRIGRADIQNRKVSLNNLVRTSIRELREEAKERDITWEIDELPDICGDQAMLRLVLDNLISNSIKFTQPRPQAIIRIGAKQERNEWIISIKDNGVGFNMEYVDKLFGVFQRLHAQDEFEGTGIGLANVRRIVSRHGGRTWAESAVGQGATFYFTLPKTKEE